MSLDTLSTSDLNHGAQSAQQTIRSKYRGLSWDKKYQGCARHAFGVDGGSASTLQESRGIGRYSDDITAAKSYDKAAVYLYGRNAITNFGLDACQKDQTEVSDFIVMAKKLVQEQMTSNYQRWNYSNSWQRNMPSTCQQQQFPGAYAPGAQLSTHSLQAYPAGLHAQQQQQGYPAPQHAQQLPMQSAFPAQLPAQLPAQQAQQYVLMQGAPSSSPAGAQALQHAYQQQQVMAMQPWQVPQLPAQQQQDMLAVASSTAPANVGTSVTWVPPAGAHGVPDVSMAAAQISNLSLTHSSVSAGAGSSMPQLLHVPQQQHPQHQQGPSGWASLPVCGAFVQEQTPGGLMQGTAQGPVTTAGLVLAGLPSMGQQGQWAAPGQVAVWN